jgi:hypothetical protein
MPRINRPSVDADIQGVTALLGTVMTLEAKTLQLASQELVPVSAMRNDVIGHARHHHDAARKAKHAQWVSSELGTPKFAPPV